MTHEELLARLDDYGYGVPVLTALRAVVELHKPYKPWEPLESLQCYECRHRHLDYPCPTIQAIEKELM